MRHHCGAPPEDGVAGEQGVVGGEREGHGVAGVTRGGDDADLEAACRDDGAVGEVVVAAADCAGWRAGELGEARGGLGVVVVAVGQDRLGDAGAGVGHYLADALEVALVERARVDDDGLGGARLEEHPRVRAIQRHRPRVGREDAVRPRRDLPTSSTHSQPSPHPATPPPRPRRGPMDMQWSCRAPRRRFS